MKKTLVWLRRELRLRDNPALYHAVQSGMVFPVYIASKHELDNGEAANCWLHHSLISLQQSLGGKLNIYSGEPQQILLKLIAKHNIDAVYWNRCYEPWRIDADAKLKTLFLDMGLECKSFNATLLWEPWQVLKPDGTCYKVFTPYKNKVWQMTPREVLPEITITNCVLDNESLNVMDLKLLPKIDWYQTMLEQWQIGEKYAQIRLQEFIQDELAGYKIGRDYPAKLNISKLSPYLHFGEISIHQVWNEVSCQLLNNTINSEDVTHFLSELTWREFAYYLVYHFPHMLMQNLQTKFDNFKWVENQTWLRKWQLGQTGYPIIDAGMRELWQTGYMHNRVRMLVASFLVKNLLIDWRHGAKWFMNCLVDADIANNTTAWQWVAGCGVDAAPYFRIFNPIMQGEKFDELGEYTRKFIPELANLPNKYLFKPWDAPMDVLNKANITLGKDYPQPIVDIAISRQRALNALAEMNVEIKAQNKQT